MLISADQIKQQFEKVAINMSSLPIFNPALRVDTLGFDVTDEINPEGYVMGVLITPWCMNLMLMPKGELRVVKEGDKVMFTFPSGIYEFISAWDETLGHYLSCSLFSPMLVFNEQETALSTAREVLTALFKAEHQSLTDLQQAKRAETARQQTDAAEQSSKVANHHVVSRRGFLTAGFCNESER
ncbi:MAG: hypothetical protein AXW15_06820 [Neptuniibacter sp. Phe_28]|nr:MAG: hypothetical protein AXW15_06820 [Neptuniibacter sp. Phe_28]